MNVRHEACIFVFHRGTRRPHSRRSSSSHLQVGIRPIHLTGDLVVPMLPALEVDIWLKGMETNNT